jgi:hypothetical protein
MTRITYTQDKSKIAKYLPLILRDTKMEKFVDVFRQQSSDSLKLTLKKLKSLIVLDALAVIQ